MKTRLISSFLAIVMVITLGLLVRSHYVLDSQQLESAIKEQLPPGTPKPNVIQFVLARKPSVWDDLGTHVKARLTGRAGNIIYRKDIVLDFLFDSNGRLLSYSKKENLTFL
jgi:hypothetical protein